MPHFSNLAFFNVVQKGGGGGGGSNPCSRKPAEFVKAYGNGIKPANIFKRWGAKVF